MFFYFYGLVLLKKFINSRKKKKKFNEQDDYELCLKCFTYHKHHHPYKYYVLCLNYKKFRTIILNYKNNSLQGHLNTKKKHHNK